VTSSSPESPGSAGAPAFHLDGERLEALLVGFLRERFRAAGFERAVIGLSGGIDSAVVCSLAVRALGAANVTVVMMPAEVSDPQSLADARQLATELGVASRVVEITPMAKSFFAALGNPDAARRGNIYARCRMIVLFDVSAELGALVLGTSNRTEILLGYGTLFGDLASSLNPLGELYKTEVRRFAEHLGIPAAIREKAPSADLWMGQLDEDELGGSYEDFDCVLVRLTDGGQEVEEIAQGGFDAHFVRAVADRVRRFTFKGDIPIIAPVPSRSAPTRGANG
jgi:NAD+ synthase